MGYALEGVIVTILPYKTLRIAGEDFKNNTGNGRNKPVNDVDTFRSRLRMEANLLIGNKIGIILL